MTAISAEDFRWHEEGGGTALASRCLDFLAQTGIEVGPLRNHKAQLLDGLAIVEGRLLVDPNITVWPSDLLHEAGHIAVAAPDDRPTLGPIDADATNEMMAIAWSYAAARVCDVNLDQLFHSGGYRDDSDWLQQAFSSGNYIGAPMLSYHGMTEPADAGALHSFPAMTRWLR